MDVKLQLKQHPKIQVVGGSINCLVLDEFAFLEPSCFDGDTPITLRNTETGEIIETTVEKAKALIEEYV